MSSTPLPEEMKTRVVHCRRERCDIYIGRPALWGNPFTIGADGTRAEVIAKYEAWIKTQPELLGRLWSLRGKVLGCWCAPLPCHGDVLARLADEEQHAILRGTDVGTPHPGSGRG